MAWHMGNPLSQTLFTSFYLDRMLWPVPKSIDEARFIRDKPNDPGNELVHLILRSYCLGLVKTCDFVHRTVGNEHYYEVGYSFQCLFSAPLGSFLTQIRR